MSTLATAPRELLKVWCLVQRHLSHDLLTQPSDIHQCWPQAQINRNVLSKSY